MSDHCTRCGSELGALDETGDKERECIRCWLGLEDMREELRATQSDPNQLSLFGDSHAA